MKSVSISRETWKKLRGKSTEEERPMKEIAEELIEEGLEDE